MWHFVVVGRCLDMYELYKLCVQTSNTVAQDKAPFGDEECWSRLVLNCRKTHPKHESVLTDTFNVDTCGHFTRTPRRLYTSSSTKYKREKTKNRYCGEAFCLKLRLHYLQWKHKSRPLNFLRKTKQNWRMGEINKTTNALSVHSMTNQVQKRGARGVWTRIFTFLIKTYKWIAVLRIERAERRAKVKEKSKNWFKKKKNYEVNKFATKRHILASGHLRYLGF